MLSELLTYVMNSDAFRLEEFPATIGRSNEATIHLEDRFSSRWHCVIGRSDDEFHVTDLDSHHGTILNGERISHAKLAPGDILQIGLHRYRVNPAGRRLFFHAVHLGVNNSANACSFEDEDESNLAEGCLVAQS